MSDFLTPREPPDEAGAAEGTDLPNFHGLREPQVGKPLYTSSLWELEYDDDSLLDHLEFLQMLEEDEYAELPSPVISTEAMIPRKGSVPESQASTSAFQSISLSDATNGSSMYGDFGPANEYRLIVSAPIDVATPLPPLCSKKD